MLEDIRQQLKKLGDDLINRMIEADPERRPTAAKVLEDEYFPPHPATRDIDSKVFIKNIIMYASRHTY